MGRAACRGASVGLEDPATKQQESVCVGMDSQELSVRRPVRGNARRGALARMVASVGAKGSAPALLDGRVPSAQSDAQRDDSGPTVLRSASATTGENVTLKPGSASVLKVSLGTGVMRSVQQEPMVRTVKVCATVLMVLAATTSMGPACVSRASAGHTAGIACVHPANTACTANAHVSVRTNTHSAATQ